MPPSGVARSMRGSQRLTSGDRPSLSAWSSRALAAAHVPLGSSSGRVPLSGSTMSRAKSSE